MCSTYTYSNQSTSTYGIKSSKRWKIKSFDLKTNNFLIQKEKDLVLNIRITQIFVQCDCYQCCYPISNMVTRFNLSNKGLLINVSTQNIAFLAILHIKINCATFRNRCLLFNFYDDNNSINCNYCSSTSLLLQQQGLGHEP